MNGHPSKPMVFWIWQIKLDYQAWAEVLVGQLQGGESKESEWQKRLDAQERDLENVKSQLRMAERDKEEASAAAQKFEADLQALSQAYSDLEVHAHSLETRQNPEGILAFLFFKETFTARPHPKQPPHDHPAGINQDSIDFMLAKNSILLPDWIFQSPLLFINTEGITPDHSAKCMWAVRIDCNPYFWPLHQFAGFAGSVQNNNGEGKQEVEEESTLDDLLACLAEEEQKVERLGQKLQELGIDPQSLIFDIGQQAETDDFT